MEKTTGRRRRFSFALAAALLIGGGGLFSGSATGHHQRRIDIQEFMTGLACAESGGRYEAVNTGSGAMGKYQIMPRNWRAWSARYLGDRWARPTPENQEFVARERIQQLYDLHHRWRVVAHWWLTGNAPHDESTWSPGPARYVRIVMRYVELASSPRTRDRVPARCFAMKDVSVNVRSEPWPRVIVKGGRVYVRRGPGPEHRSFDVARRGDRLAVLGRRRSDSGAQWLRVGLQDGRIGWIYAAYTRPTESLR